MSIFSFRFSFIGLLLSLLLSFFFSFVMSSVVHVKQNSPECEIDEAISNSSLVRYIHLRTNTFSKGMNPYLLPKQWVEYWDLCLELIIVILKKIINGLPQKRKYSYIKNIFRLKISHKRLITCKKYQLIFFIIFLFQLFYYSHVLFLTLKMKMV